MTHPGPNDVALPLAEVLQLIGQHERTAERYAEVLRELHELTQAVNAYLDAHDAFVLVRANRETTAKEITDTGFDRANTLRALRETVAGQ